MEKRQGLPFGRSLNFRVTLISLAIFVASIWTLTLYLGHMLRDDLEQLLGAQQLSTASIVAEEINQELNERLHGLEQIARSMRAAQLDNPKALTSAIESNPLFLEMFNAGAYVTDINGTAIASTPKSANRVGVNYMDRDHIQNVLLHGKSSISEPVIGRQINVPVVAIAVPIHNAVGRIIGAVSGVVNLSANNFLDNIISHRYGTTGGYLVVDPKHRRYVTATNKSYVLQPVPAPGLSPMNDRYMAGYEGFGVAVSSSGVESLSAARSIPASGWYVMALLPTEEAFAPIRSMQVRMLIAASALTVLAGALFGLLLRHQLDPLRFTAERLNELSLSSAFPQALPVKRQDEIGLLVGAFNRLLVALHQREVALNESQQHFSDLVEFTPNAIAVHAAGTLLFVNPATVELLQAPSAEALLGRSVIEFVHPDFRSVALERKQISNTADVKLPPLEYPLYTLQGHLIYVEVRSIAITYDGQPASQMVMYDVTQRKHNEEKLRQLSRITEQAPLAVVITSLDGTIEYVNPRFSEVTGFASEEVIGRNPRILQSGQTPAQTYVDMWATLVAGGVWRGEFYNRRKDGAVFVEQAVLAPVLDAQGKPSFYVALKEDITLAKKNQQRLEQLLREKTALLHEVHHRVKNNLQVVTSLLRLEEGRTQPGTTRSVLQDMRGRIRSMALVHETLYRSGTFAAVDLHSYIQQVASEVFRAQSHSNVNVRLALNLSPVRASMDQATPCGLLINELVSNALKHGFPDGRHGEIRVELQPSADAGSDQWCLRVQDTGIGLPDDFEARRKQSLGLQLVSDLTQQLRGTLHTACENGAVFEVTLRITPPVNLSKTV